MRRKEKIELLAPAGNKTCFIAACNAGADAIYMGMSKFNARAMAQNFTEEEYIEAIDYAHLRGIKVYLTLNTLMYDDEIKEALEMVLKLYSYGLDAVILQDIGVANLMHSMLPKLHLHASTQMSVYSLEQAQYLQSIGFTRIVLARELTIEEIKYICENIDVEIEVFVHGALCVSLSGQCLLSSTIGNRSANRGRCAQPCRMKYSLLNSKGKTIVSNTYLLSKKDIYGLSNLKDMIGASIASLKIEGRNKTPEYVALIVSKYRKYIDQYYSNGEIRIEENDQNEMMQMFNRDGMSTGYLNGVNYKESITLRSPKNTGLYLGTVISQKNMYIKIKLEKDINLHDGIEIYSEENVISNIVTCIRDENYHIINKEAKAGEYIWIGDISKKVKYGSSVYKTSSYVLNNEVSKKYVSSNRNRRELKLDIQIEEGKKLVANIYDDDGFHLEYLSDIVPEKALKKSLQGEDILSTFSKTLDTAFVFHIQNLKLDDNLFIPVSKLNEMRRGMIQKLAGCFITRNNIDDINIEKWLDIKGEKILDTTPINSLYIYQYDDQIDYLQKYGKIDRIDIGIGDFIKYEDSIFKKYLSRVNIAIYIPNFVLKNLDHFIKENLERIVLRGIDTIILSSFSYLEIVKHIREKKSIKLIGDYSFNIANKYSAIFMKHVGFDAIVPSFDISISDILEISEYIGIELVQDFITVMTSRYCVLGSFVANRNTEKCSAPCIKEKYYLTDAYGYQYHIVCDNTDCIMRLVKISRNIDLKENHMKNIYCVRKAIV
ncbi:MAG: U32 family peptidase [Clostridia bacterium]|nr:U32 family peptidase [Clostridia bacterium]